MTMTNETSIVHFGVIVFENDFSIVRAKTVCRKGYPPYTQVVVHRRVNGIEQTPRGYILGDNMARFRDE